MSASLTLRGVTASHGPRPVLHDVDLTLAPGRRIGVVGPNGVGKSTLLAVAAGIVVPDAGAAVGRPPPASIGVRAQGPGR